MTMDPIQTTKSTRLVRLVRVLDHGYVRLTDYMGSDLSVVNAARASYLKESDQMTAKDEKLIAFLLEHGHTSPFRHATLQFEIKAPVVMVGRQWFKYRVGSKHTDDSLNSEMELLTVYLGNGDDDGFDDPLYARNEASRRYVTMEPEFYVPDEWRGKPANSKQGSDGPVEWRLNQAAKHRLAENILRGMADYDWALEQGICAEQARLFLPYTGMYTVWRWTASLAAVLHFLQQRLGHDAQWEIAQYAKAVHSLVYPLFPVTMRSVLGQESENGQQ